MVWQDGGRLFVCVQLRREHCGREEVVVVRVEEGLAGAMAVCPRVVLRHAQLLLLVRTPTTFATGLTHRNVGFGFGFGVETEVGSSSPSSSPSSSSYSSWCWEEERWRWSSWRHLVPTREVHGTAWRADGEDEEKQSMSGLKEEVAARVGNEEARNLVQQVHCASLKKRLRDDPRDTISFQELTHICRTVGMASDDREAAEMAHVFNQAGVVLTFRDKVHLHPEKIAELVANVLPLSLLGEDDQRRMELLALTKTKDEIDRKAHKQMRFVLWTGLCGLTIQVLVFFRLTFWELSWDVMEPIAFFATASGIICGYTYFMFTSRDPTYQDFMHRIYHSRQRKLVRKQNFDMKRYKELQMQCQSGWRPLNKKILEDDD